MTERIEEAIATVTAKEHYSLDPLGPGGRPVGSGDLCGRECPFEGLGERQDEMVITHHKFP
jgi:hypothetical protein